MEPFSRGISSEAGCGWDSQDEDGLFDVTDRIPSASQSLASVTPDRSLEMISGRRSRVSSQENGKAASTSLMFLHNDFSCVCTCSYRGEMYVC